MDPASELLKELKGLSVPVDGGFALAPGWWVLIALLCLLLGWWVRRWWQRPPAAPDWRPAAREELSRLQSLLPETPAVNFMAECSRLCRRIALAAAPRAQVAALHGEPWLQQLDELSGSDLFTTGPGRMLLSGPYQREDESAHLESKVTNGQQSLTELLSAVETLFQQCAAKQT